MEKFAKAYHISWPFVALIIAHLIWGGNFIAAKLTLNEIPPQSLAFLRFTLAALFLLPFLIVENKSWRVANADLPKLFLVGVLLVTLHIAFFFEGLSRTSVTHASALLLLIPILSALFGWRFLKEKLNFLNVLGVGLGLIGALVIVGLGNLVTQQESSPESILGNFYIILSAIFWVVGALLSKKLLSHYSPLTITWIMFVVGSITFLIPALNDYVQNPNWINQISLLGLVGLSYITVGSSVSAYFLFEWSVKRIGVYKADLFQYIEPLIASGLGILLLSEPLEPTFIVGATLITIGAVLGTYSRHLHLHHHKSHRG